jgi:hypothetical protein
MCPVRFAKWICLSAVILNMPGVVTFAGDTNDPVESRRMLQSLQESGKTISDGIRLAEQTTGGTAIAAELLDRRQIEGLYGR